MSETQAVVMVVEDDLDVCESLEAIVHALGHVCHTFDSAEVFLQHWNDNHQDGNNRDVVILDIDLPQMDGIELLSTLRENGSSPPTIIHTGRNDARLREATKAFDDIPIVLKGHDGNRIADLLRSLIGTFRNE